MGRGLLSEEGGVRQEGSTERLYAPATAGLTKAWITLLMGGSPTEIKKKGFWKYAICEKGASAQTVA